MKVLFFAAATILLAAQVSAQGPTVTVAIHRIVANDPIDGAGDQADWYYRVGFLSDPTAGTYVWQSSPIPIANNKDDLTVDQVHQFTGPAGATLFQLAITVCDKDYYFWEGSDDRADISSSPGGGSDNVGSPCPASVVQGATSRATYDLASNRFVEGDRVEFDGTYYRTSGDWDGSTSIDENDATLYFQITDNYEPPSPSPSPSPSPTPTPTPTSTPTPTPTPASTLTPLPSPPISCSLYVLTCPTGQQLAFFIRGADESQLYSDSTCLVPTTFQCPTPAASPTVPTLSPASTPIATPDSSPRGPPFTPPGPPPSVPPVQTPGYVTPKLNPTSVPLPILASPVPLPIPASLPSPIPGASPPADEVADLRPGDQGPGWQKRGPVLLELKLPDGKAEQVAAIYYQQDVEPSVREVLGSLADVLPPPTLFVLTSRRPGFSDAAALNLTEAFVAAELKKYDATPFRYGANPRSFSVPLGSIARLPKESLACQAGQKCGYGLSARLGQLEVRGIVVGWNVSDVAVGVGGYYPTGKITRGGKTVELPDRMSDLLEPIRGIQGPSNPPIPGFEAALAIAALVVAYLFGRKR